MLTHLPPVHVLLARKSIWKLCIDVFVPMSGSPPLTVKSLKSVLTALVAFKKTQDDKDDVHGICSRHRTRIRTQPENPPVGNEKSWPKGGRRGVISRLHLDSERRSQQRDTRILHGIAWAAWAWYGPSGSPTGTSKAGVPRCQLLHLPTQQMSMFRQTWHPWRTCRLPPDLFGVMLSDSLTFTKPSRPTWDLSGLCQHALNQSPYEVMPTWRTHKARMRNTGRCS